VSDAGPAGLAAPPADAADLVVRHLDAALVVVDKPAGLLSVPGRGPHLQDCAAARVQARFADALIVHRLDMATSGLLLFARGPEVQRVLSRAFAQREVHKRYVAVVAGPMHGERGEIDLPLIADWPNRPLQKVDREHGKPSLTRWRALGIEGERTRLELEPVTGRAHQLRVHLQAIGHPIVGDALYAPAEVRAGAARLLLHAAALRFAHPVGSETLEIESAVPF
jgi:tRNA pseudouridine32 synthase/23S rRNA pseudouridine746 synthase